MAVNFIEPCEVKALLTGEERTKTLILDVRDEDFAGGNIVGAVNVWTDQFETHADVDAFIAEHIPESKGVETVVCHCMMSMQRGPFAARRIAARLAASGRSKPTVVVLLHGFRRFVQMYGDDPELCENVSSMWRR